MNKLIVNGIEYAYNSNDTVVIIGNELLINGVVKDNYNPQNQITIDVKGSPVSITTNRNVHVDGNIGQNVTTQGDVTCGDVGQNVTAQGDVLVAGSSLGGVGGNLVTQGDVRVTGNVAGNIKTMGDVDVGGSAGKIITQGDVKVGSK